MEDVNIEGRMVAYFLLPLPEPLGIPEGVPFRTMALEDYGDFLRRSEDENHSFTEGPRPQHAVSLVAHHLEVGGGDPTGVHALMDLAEKVLPWARNPKSLRKQVRFWLSRFKNSRRPRMPLATRDLTVIEMATLVQEEGDLVERLSESFDAGLAFVQDVQRAYTILRKYPITLCTRESLPPMIPYALGRPRYGKLPESHAGLSIYMLNKNLWQFQRDDTMTESDLDTLDAALGSLATNHAFLTYIDCVREAHLALDRRGDYRAAVIFSATAAESLLDDLLLLLLWEEAATPEEGAELFMDPRKGLRARVSSEYAQRIGGRWSTSQTGAAKDWSMKIAGVRHRTVHGGYVPPIEEARDSVEALHELEQFIAGRLTQPKQLAKYPRTAMALVGRPGLERRGLWNGKIKALATDESEPNWSELFGRWRGAVEGIRLRAQGAGVEPEEERSVLLHIVVPKGEPFWVLHDREAGMAALASSPVVTESEWAAKSDKAIREASAKVGIERASSIAWAAGDHGCTTIGEWLPDYHLVPEAPVMRDQSDPGLRRVG